MSCAGGCVPLRPFTNLWKVTCLSPSRHHVSNPASRRLVTMASTSGSGGQPHSITTFAARAYDFVPHGGEWRRVWPMAYAIPLGRGWRKTAAIPDPTGPQPKLSAPEYRQTVASANRRPRRTTPQHRVPSGHTKGQITWSFGGTFEVVSDTGASHKIPSHLRKTAISRRIFR
jgi:hypothetical protein